MNELIYCRCRSWAWKFGGLCEILAGGPIAERERGPVAIRRMHAGNERGNHPPFFPAHLANLSIYCFIAQEPKRPQLQGKLYPTIRHSLNGARKIKSIDQIKVLAKRRRGMKEGQAPNRDRLFVGVRRNRTKKSQMRCIVCLLRVQFHSPGASCMFVCSYILFFCLWLVMYERERWPHQQTRSTLPALVNVIPY